jgi:hypothetical protein
MELAEEGEILAMQGLQRATDKADKDFPDWKERCWDLFKEWINLKPPYYEFMIETFRTHCERNAKIETPNSKTAYGFIPLKALREGLIERWGYGKVSNAKAHNCAASVWRKIKN